MIRVSNRKTIRCLGRKAMGAARTRNLIAITAIALTTVLFTALFTIALSINDGFQEADVRHGGSGGHGGGRDLT